MSNDSSDISPAENEPGQGRLEALRSQAQALPESPGVYLMKDAEGTVIYVGKAKILPRRVSSYFQKNPSSVRIGMMVAKVASFEFVVTATEKESLILENRLIKKYRPRYNVVLRDDKTYPSLRLSLNEEFPRLEIVRRPPKDGSMIFGPFPSASAMKDTVRMALRLFPLRQCRRPDVKNIERPCLNYQMGRCVGPCRPEMTVAEYRQITEQVRLFFRGRHTELIDSLTREMKEAAECYEFELAARLRDRLNNIRKTLERQIVDQGENRDMDVFGFYRKDGLLQGAVLLVRSGAVTGCVPLESAGEGDDLAEDVVSLLTQYYGVDSSKYDRNWPEDTDRFGQATMSIVKPAKQAQRTAPGENLGMLLPAETVSGQSLAVVPDEVLLPEEFLPTEGRATLEDWLSELKGRAVKILAPQRGDKTKLLSMAADNARAALEDRLGRIGRNRGVMVELKARLGLETVPRRLECFDLAHLQGQNAAAGLVVMEDCEWKKEHYRRFKIKSAKGGDDYGGMREVVARRFSHEEWPSPDLLLIDGGKGQLAAALAAFEDLGLKPPALAAIAKIRQEGDIDRVFIPGRKNPVDLKSGSAGLLLLARLRDEAHRYVGTYHHRLQARTFMDSPLLAAPGLGPVKRRKLLDHFSSLENLAEATDEQIKEVISLSSEGLTALRASLAGWRRALENKTDGLDES